MTTRCRELVVRLVRGRRGDRDILTIKYEGIRGDLNCDGAVNGFDIDMFVVALSAADDYRDIMPGCNRMRADANGDRVVDGFDIDAFVQLLAGE
jgi:hypothetical protein